MKGYFLAYPWPRHKDKSYVIDHFINRGGWWGKTWLIVLGIDGSVFVVEADNECDALDMFIDSKYYSRIKCSQEDAEKYGGWGGNKGKPYMDEEMIIRRCDVERW